MIRTAGDLARGAAELARIEPRFLPAIAAAGDAIPLRLRPPGFETLLYAIVGQQVSTAAAAAIWARVQAAGLDQRDAVLAAGDEALRAVGLSRPKVRYARALAEAGFDFDALTQMDDTAATAALTALPGIGRWTAEIYLLFSLGRPDVLPAVDLALQIAAGDLVGDGTRLGEADLRSLAEAWSPWRGVAARLLWVWYRVDRGREGVAL